jgi:hypothetical protein
MAKAKTRIAQITFCVQGSVTQQVRVPAKMTDDELLEGLQLGEIVTSISEGGNVDRIVGEAPTIEWSRLGTVLALVSNDLEYSDFEVEEM